MGFRKRGALLGAVLLAMVCLSPVILLILFGAYTVKSSLGIDFFADKHLSDFITEILQ